MKGRPHVCVNFALTWDARVSTRNHTPSDFSSPRDKRRLLEIRATGDAVLVGVGTVAADHMTMTLPGEVNGPLRVLVSNSGRIDPALRVFTKSTPPIVIFSTQRMSQRTRTNLAHMADLWLHEGGTVDLTRVLATLRAEYRVRRVVCEGGPRLFRSLLALGLVDEIRLTLASRIFGGVKAPTLTGVADRFLARSTRCALRGMEVIDGECFLRYRVLR